jgi:hypothetical protein
MRHSKGGVMKPSLVLLAAAAALVSAVAASSRVFAADRQAALLRLPPAAAAGQIVSYGHIKSLTRRGRRFEMRFDPAWWLTGFTAQRAKLADTGSSDVPNDYYIVEEGHRPLTYLVAPRAHVTVLTNGTRATVIPVSELAQIVQGRNPKHRRLSEPKAGFWIRVGSKYPNPVLSLDQQYQP